MAICNIQFPPSGIEIKPTFDKPFGDFNQTELKIIPFADIQEDVILLASAEFPNAVTGFWFLEQLRLDDGFRATFKATAEGGTADGFAFVIQDDRDEDTLGSAGAALGFQDVFPRYISVAFDFCSDRPVCSEQSIRIDRRLEGEASSTLESASPQGLFGNAEEGSVDLDIRIDYLADIESIEVFIDNRLVISTGLSLADVLLDKFAFFGLTASNADSRVSNVSALNLKVENMVLTQYLSGFKMRPEAFLLQQVDFGQVVTFTFDIVNFCNEPLESPPLLGRDQVSAFLQDREQEPNRVEFRQLTQTGATVELLFVTTPEVIATYDLEIEVNGVLIQDSPLESIVQASRPASQGVSVVGAVLLGSLSLVVFVLIVVAGRGFWKYKSKLDEHEEDIEFGKTKEVLDEIDKTITYHMNPLVAPLNLLKERLERNKRLIEEMKQGQQNAVDSDFTVEQLHEENEELRKQIVEVKRQKEFADAADNISLESEEEFVFVPPPRQAFDDEDFGGQPEGDEIYNEQMREELLRELSDEED